jgi:hypothetical protein
MFCPSCGAEYAIELKYCNRCGANLSSSVAPQPEPVTVSVTKPTLIIGVLMLLVTLGGFGALVGGAISLAPILHDEDAFMAIIMFGMLTILIVDIFLVRLLSKLIGAALPSKTQPRTVYPSIPAGMPAQFQPPTTTARLQPTPSVTENTTRFFDPYSAPAESPKSEKIKR